MCQQSGEERYIVMNTGKIKRIIKSMLIVLTSFIVLFNTMYVDTFASTVLRKGSIGIDVSKWQGNIDWNTVKNSSGIQFAIIRVGFGNNQYNQDDTYAEYNMSECERLGIPYGVYLYSYAMSENEAYSEVAHIKRMLNGRKPPMGVYIDVEASSYYSENGLDYTSASGRRRITDYVKIILQGISSLGCSAGYYANVFYNENVLYKNELSGYRWIAGYGDYEDYCKNNGALMWQYTSSGTVQGISSANVDMNKLLKDFIIDESNNSSGSTVISGWKEIDGKTYYYTNGKKNTGWIKVDGSWYYMDANGVMQTNCWISGVYYLKSDGKMAVSEWVDNGRYYVDANGVWVPGKTKDTAGWKEDGTGKWYQNTDGTRIKNQLKQIDGKWYYFNASGYVTKGWQRINGSWYYMDANGVMMTNCWISGVYYLKSDGRMAVSEWVDNGRYYVDANGVWVPGKTKDTSGWKEDNIGRWYQNTDGTRIKNELKQIDGKWYYFNASGYVTKGWQRINGSWYYMDANGVMLTNRWINGVYYLKSDGKMAVSEWVDNGRYYVDANGVWVPGKTKDTAGWKEDGTGKWYQNTDGTRIKNQLKQIDGKWYYFNASGYVTKGWQRINGSWYYMDANGVMLTNRWISGVYYLKSDGKMAVSEWVDNNRYYVDGNGVWVPNATH